MDPRPAMFTVVLQAGYVCTKERSEPATTVYPLAFIAKLIVQDIGLHFNLKISTRQPYFQK